MIYKARKGSRISDDDAQIYGDRLSILVEENNGLLSPEIVVDDAKNPDSPLHDYFNWDDKVEAVRHRVHMARLLISSIAVVIEREEIPIKNVPISVSRNDRPIEPRAFNNVRVYKNEISDRGYTTLLNVLTDEDLRKQTVIKALRELRSWCSKYRIYDELTPIASDIDHMIDEFWKK